MTGGGRGRRPGLLVLHVLALVALLAVAASLTDLERSWTPDDGSYAVQARLVRDGRWDYPYRHADIDPDGLYDPVRATRGADGRHFPLVKHRVWIMGLVAGTAVFGDVVGLHVPAYAGLVAAAVAGWFLAEALRPRAGPWVFWAVGLGPLLVQSTGLWAHSAAAACGGLLALLVVRVAQGSARWFHHALAAGAALAVVLVRNEGLVAVAATALVLAALGGRGPGGVGPRLLRAGWVAAPTLVAGGIGFQANRVLTRDLLGRTGVPSGVGAPSGGGWLGDRVTGGARALLDGTGGSATTVAAVVAVALLVVGGRALGAGGGARARRDAVVLVGAGTVVTGVVVGFFALDYLGLLVAAPLLPLGLGAVRWSRATRAERSLAALVAVMAAGVLANQTAVGGGRDWGGRYLAIAVVPAVALAWTGLCSVGEHARRRAGADGGAAARPTAVPPPGRPAPLPRWGSVVLVAVLVAGPSVGGLWATGQTAQLAHDNTEVYAGLDETPVVVTFVDEARLGWRYLPDADWLAAEPETVGDLLARLRPKVTGPLRVLGAGAAEIEAPGYRKDVLGPLSIRLSPVGS